MGREFQTAAPPAIVILFQPNFYSPLKSLLFVKILKFTFKQKDGNLIVHSIENEKSTIIWITTNQEQSRPKFGPLRLVPIAHLYEVLDL